MIFKTVKEVLNMSMTSLIIRHLFKKSDTKRDEGLTIPNDVIRDVDIKYGDNAKWNLLDIYRPKDYEKPLPVIISIHGGGWVYGDKELYQYYCMDLALRGFAVINFTYRLAPKYKFPSQLQDCVDVFDWVNNNADKYDFDINHLYALGDSAGGHLLSLYCDALADETYAKKLGIVVKSNKIPNAVALNCGVYNIEFSEKKDFTARLMKDLMPNKGTKEELDLISPIKHLSKFPPSFVMTANGDFVFEQAKPMFDKLKELNNYSELHVYGDDNNKLAHVFHLNMKSLDAKKCNDEECEFFKKY